MALVDANILRARATASRGQGLRYLLRANLRAVAEKKARGVVVKPLTLAEATEIAGWYWAIGTQEEIDPAPALAQAIHETAAFVFGGQVSAAQHNPAGLGATNDGAAGGGWLTWRGGIDAHYVHLLAWCNDRRGDADYRLAAVRQEAKKKGWATTWESLGGRWAVPGLLYGAGIERHWAAIIAEGGSMARIAISAGHHNTDGGNRFEYQTVGELAESIAAAARFQGIDVYVPQPDGGDADDERGDGDYAGGLQGVARAVVAEHARAPFSVFLECHTQGGPQQRGVFGIYPDMAGDLDTDARDNLIPRIVRKVRDYTGIPIWSNGLLPESRTGVGLGGSRLGVFYASASIKAECTRLLIEYGAHDTAEDAAIQRTPQFYVGAARATVEGICEFLGLPVKAWGGVVGKESIVPIVPAKPDSFPEAGSAEWFLNARGEALVCVNFGGAARTIEGVALVDIGVTVVNEAGERYHRSVADGAFTEWLKVGG